jgi:hypothetical protein
MTRAYIKVIFWLLALIITISGVCSAWNLLSTKGVSQANYQKIRKGMSRDEVQKLLGGPPGNYTIFRNVKAPGIYASGTWYFYTDTVHWIGDSGVIEVTFQDGKVMVSRFISSVQGADPLPSEITLHHVLHRLRLKLSGRWPAEANE